MSAPAYQEFGADSRLLGGDEPGLMFSDAHEGDIDGVTVVDGRTVGARMYSVENGVITGERRYAVNTFPTYPGGGPQITVDTSLQQPNIIARALTALAYQRFVADKIFMKGTPEQIRGGAAVFNRSESLFPDRTAETRQPRAGWKRTGWTVPDLFASPVQQFGLEAPVNDLARRRNSFDELARAQLKLANAVVKSIDAAAILLITTDAAVNQFTATTTWSSGSPTIVADLAAVRNQIVNIDLGYEPDTLIINPAQETSMITSAALQAILPRESTPRNAALTGLVVPLMGLRQILVTNQIAAGKGIMCQSNIVGSIADEPPLTDEGYSSYDPGGGQAAIQVKKYRVEDMDDTILRAARFAAMWIGEPKAATYMQGL
jgi:hypothetical protein